MQQQPPLFWKRFWNLVAWIQVHRVTRASVRSGTLCQRCLIGLWSGYCHAWNKQRPSPSVVTKLETHGAQDQYMVSDFPSSGPDYKIQPQGYYLVTNKLHRCHCTFGQEAFCWHLRNPNLSVRLTDGKMISNAGEHFSRRLVLDSEYWSKRPDNFYLADLFCEFVWHSTTRLSCCYPNKVVFIAIVENIVIKGVFPSQDLMLFCYDMPSLEV